MFSKLFKSNKKSMKEVSLLNRINECTFCEVPEEHLKKCDNCRNRSICRSCSKENKILCYSCDQEYNKWYKSVKRAAKKADREDLQKKIQQNNKLFNKHYYQGQAGELLDMDEDFQIF